VQNKKTTNISIENKKSVLRILEHNILHILYADNIVLEIKDIDELYTSYNALPDPKPLKVLSEMGDFSSITTEAKKPTKIFNNFDALMRGSKKNEYC